MSASRKTARIPRLFGALSPRQMRTVRRALVRRRVAGLLDVLAELDIELVKWRLYARVAGLRTPEALDDFLWGLRKGGKL